jgi:pyridinium-3,5-bisthiocarboxylic acid mononucleotide nickel chelatase
MSGRLLYVDPVAGVAGDMLCGALLDAGGDLAALRRGLEGLGIDGFEISTRTVQRGAFRATHFSVRPASAGTVESGALSTGRSLADGGAHDGTHAHSHGHTHDHAGAGHDGQPDAGREPVFPNQPDRTWRSISALLHAADLPSRVRVRAIRVFTALANAEARAHGLPADDVHFHEVGGVDAIVDITAACLLLEQLGVDQVVCGPVPVGSGTVRSAHGMIPIPAPATATLLSGWPVTLGQPGLELTTPTGAALIAALAEPGSIPDMTLEGQGFGAGSRDPGDHANICRVLLGRAAAANTAPEIVVVAAQMDDLTGEHLPALIDALLAAGAVDAFATPVLMKKGRSGLLVEAHARPATEDAVARAMLRHGSTFGVRAWTARRRVLDRWHTTSRTPWGEVRVKVGALDGEVLQTAPEYEDVQSVARAAGQPAPRVHWAALQALTGTSPGPRES